MPTPVALERFVGPPVHAHGRGEVAIHEGEFSPQLIVPAHMHDVAVVSLMLKGQAIEQVHDGTRELAPQDLIFTPAFEMHAYRFPQAGRWFNMQLSDPWLARVTDGNPLAYRSSQIVRSQPAAAWATRVRTEVRHTDTVSSLAIDGAMMLMIAGATIANFVRQRRIERARAEIATGRPLSTIALDAGFADQSHFTRLFKQAFGETPGQYARSIRAR